MSTSANPASDDDTTRPVEADSRHSADDGTRSYDRREIVARERDQFGGMKVGSAFFGWLAASGTAVLLTALVAAGGTALGLGQNIDTTEPTAADAQTVGLVGGIILLVVIFVAYLCGGYVAGRMARFNGIKQGLGVWLWAIVIAIVVAILSVLAGNEFDILSRVNGFPRIPLNEGTLTTAGIVIAIGLTLVSLLGAILGGLTGMRFHRRVDKAGLGR